MKLKDIEVDFSFTDADDLERFENEAKKVKEKAENYKKEEMSMSDAIREECKIIEDFFDGVFGEKTSEKLFKWKKDLKEHIDVFTDIVNEKVKQTEGFKNMYDNIEYRSKYMPNREQRRYNKFKGRK